MSAEVLSLASSVEKIPYWKLIVAKLVKNSPPFIEPEIHYRVHKSTPSSRSCIAFSNTASLLRLGQLEAGGLPLVGCPGQPSQYMQLSSIVWGSLLHAQPEDTPPPPPRWIMISFDGHRIEELVCFCLLFRVVWAILCSLLPLSLSSPLLFNCFLWTFADNESRTHIFFLPHSIASYATFRPSFS